MKCQQRSKIGTSCRNTRALHHEEHEVLEGKSHCLGHGNGALHFFYELAHGIARAFMVTKLLRLFTMKSMKGLKVNPAALDTKPELSTSSSS